MGAEINSIIMGENLSVRIPFLVKFYQFRRQCGPLESLLQARYSIKSAEQHEDDKDGFFLFTPSN